MYVRDGDAYVGTILTQGGWDPAQANGGTVLTPAHLAAFHQVAVDEAA